MSLKRLRVNLRLIKYITKIRSKARGLMNLMQSWFSIAGTQLN